MSIIGKLIYSSKAILITRYFGNLRKGADYKINFEKQIAEISQSTLQRDQDGDTCPALY